MYASTANIEEVMKFYNLGHKTFETDFSTCCEKLEKRVTRKIWEKAGVKVSRDLTEKVVHFSTSATSTRMHPLG